MPSPDNPLAGIPFIPPAPYEVHPLEALATGVRNVAKGLLSPVAIGEQLGDAVYGDESPSWTPVSDTLGDMVRQDQSSRALAAAGHDGQNLMQRAVEGGLESAAPMALGIATGGLAATAGAAPVLVAGAGGIPVALQAGADQLGSDMDRPDLSSGQRLVRSLGSAAINEAAMMTPIGRAGALGTDVLLAQDVAAGLLARRAQAQGFANLARETGAQATQGALAGGGDQTFQAMTDPDPSVGYDPLGATLSAGVSGGLMGAGMAGAHAGLHVAVPRIVDALGQAPGAVADRARSGLLAARLALADPTMDPAAEGAPQAAVARAGSPTGGPSFPSYLQRLLADPVIDLPDQAPAAQEVADGIIEPATSPVADAGAPVPGAAPGGADAPPAASPADQVAAVTATAVNRLPILRGYVTTPGPVEFIGGRDGGEPAVLHFGMAGSGAPAALEPMQQAVGVIPPATQATYQRNVRLVAMRLRDNGGAPDGTFPLDRLLTVQERLMQPMSRNEAQRLADDLASPVTAGQVAPALGANHLEVSDGSRGEPGTGTQPDAVAQPPTADATDRRGAVGTSDQVDPQGAEAGAGGRPHVGPAEVSPAGADPVGSDVALPPTTATPSGPFAIGDRVRFIRGARQGMEVSVSRLADNGRPIVRTDDGTTLGGSQGIHLANLEKVHESAAPVPEASPQAIPPRDAATNAQVAAPAVKPDAVRNWWDGAPLNVAREAVSRNQDGVLTMDLPENGRQAVRQAITSTIGRLKSGSRLREDLTTTLSELGGPEGGQQRLFAPERTPGDDQSSERSLSATSFPSFPGDGARLDASASAPTDVGPAFATGTTRIDHWNLPSGMVAIPDHGQAGQAIRELATWTSGDRQPADGRRGIIYGRVSADEAREIQERTGIEVRPGAWHGVDSSAIAHALRQHGDAASESSRGQLPVTADDLAALPGLLTPDHIVGSGTVRSTSGDGITYEVERPDGSLIVADAVLKGGRALMLNTLRKLRPKMDGDRSGGDGLPSGEQSPTAATLTPEAVPGKESPSTSTLPATAGGDKRPGGRQFAPERTPGSEGYAAPSRMATDRERIPVKKIDLPPQEPGKPNDLPKPVQRFKDMISNLADALTKAGVQVKVEEGLAPKGTGGFFDPDTGLLAISRHGDLDATAHEVGHRLTDRFKLNNIEGQGIAGERAWFARFGSEPDHGEDPAAYRAHEGWAEFLRAWTVNPEATEAKAPAMTRAFMERVPAEVRAALTGYGEAAQHFLALPPHIRTEANLQAIQSLVLRGMWHRAINDWFNLPGVLAAYKDHPTIRGKVLGMLREMWGREPVGRAGLNAPNPERLEDHAGGLVAAASGKNGMAKWRWAWQNVMAPAYERINEAWERQGSGLDAQKPENNWRIRNRLLAGVDKKAADQVFSTGLSDGRERTYFDHETGEPMTIGWILDPALAGGGRSMRDALTLFNTAMAQGVEERTVQVADRRLAAADQRIQDFTKGLDDIAGHKGSVEDLERLVQTYREAVGPAGDDKARALMVEGRRVLAATKPDPRTFTRWTEEFSKAVREQTKAENSRISGIGGSLVSDEAQARAALKVRSGEAQRSLESRKDQADVDEILRRYRAFAQQVIIRLGQQGVFSGETVERIQKSGEWTDPETGKIRNLYFDLHRIFEGEDGPARVGGRFKGSTRIIANPLKNLAEGAAGAIVRGERNAAMQSLVEAVRGKEGGGAYLADLGQQVPEEAVKESHLGGRQGLVNGRKPYRVVVDGTPEWWTFHPDIELGLESARRQRSANVIIQTIAGLTRLTKATITTFPSFMVRNLIRDTHGRLVTSETAKGMGMRDILQSFGTLPTEDGGKRKVADLYIQSGAGYAGHGRTADELGRELARHLSDLQLHGWGKWKVTIMSPARWMQGLESLNENLERINRQAEFRSAWTEAKGLGFDDYNAMLYAGDKARGLMDFAEQGYLGGQLNQWIPFFNPAIQANARAERTFALYRKHITDGKTPSEQVQRALTHRLAVSMLAITGASVGLRMAVNALWGKDDEERWRQQPAYIRDMHWMLPVGGGHLIAVPKEQTWGWLSSGGERLADYLIAKGEVREDDARRAFEGYSSSAAGALLPINDATDLFGAWRPLIEAATNYDFYRMRHIIPPGQEGKDLDLMKGDRTWTERFWQNLTGKDGRLVNHVAEGFGGNWYRAAEGADRGLAWNLGSISGVGKSDALTQSRDVTWVRENAQAMGQTHARDVQALGTLIHRAYDPAIDDTTRQIRVDAAVKQATAVRQRMERDQAAK